MINNSNLYLGQSCITILDHSFAMYNSVIIVLLIFNFINISQGYGICLPFYKNGTYNSYQLCVSYCCGECDNRFCCIDESKILNQTSCPIISTTITQSTVPSTYPGTTQGPTFFSSFWFWIILVFLIFPLMLCLALCKSLIQKKFEFQARNATQFSNFSPQQANTGIDFDTLHQFDDAPPPTYSTINLKLNNTMPKR
ncbi:hypothetical protein BpHYR1_000212 [Brachionus plicatilis]|uniref:Shisa N-terminal domain-containing protein n=1 Tax=Brachionus plicatilis TaxID=10195 RepID=A0A3M7SD62_BRAPC|nr:hypothetical protein BpHYR1_000212 [Brachionus plicatilis]